MIYAIGSSWRAQVTTITDDALDTLTRSLPPQSSMMRARLERSSTPRRSSRVSEDLWRIEDLSPADSRGLGDDARAPRRMPGLHFRIYLCMASGGSQDEDRCIVYRGPPLPEVLKRRE